MGTPPAQHERFAEASSKLREPILKCPDALESSETIFSASIFWGFFHVRFLVNGSSEVKNSRFAMLFEPLGELCEVYRCL